MRLAIVTNILTPYRMPLFAAMRARVERLHVFVMAAREENRDWQLPEAPFEWSVLPGWHVRPPRAAVSRHLNFGVGRALRRFGPDAVLSGGFAPGNFGAWRYCRRSRCAFVNWGELSRRDLTAASPLKRALRRALIAGADGAIASSSEAREVFVHYGAEPERVLTALMPIDVGDFHSRTLAARSGAEFSAARAALSSPVLLSVGRLVEGKGYPELFEIYGALLRSHPGATLLIVGDGPRRAAYEALVRARGWKNVLFTGFQQSEALPKYLALADLFVFPTLADTFGAVLCEAMAAELPVVSSVHAAATLDLITDGVTGFRIEPRDVEASAAVVRRTLDMSASQRAALGARAYGRVKQLDIAPTADAMVDFLRTPPRPRGSGNAPHVVVSGHDS